MFKLELVLANWRQQREIFVAFKCGVGFPLTYLINVSKRDTCFMDSTGLYNFLGSSAVQLDPIINGNWKLKKKKESQ